MLPTDRHQQILRRLAERGVVYIDELSREFAVSAMTVHRDLDQLEADGYLRKVRGGAVPAARPPAAATQTCFMCHTAPRSQTQVTLHLADGDSERACCPHCGLHGLELLGERVVSILVADFLRGHAVNAQTAVYLVEPAATICCTPTVLAFQKMEDAQRFQRGFGGEILDISAAQRYLRQAMHF